MEPDLYGRIGKKLQTEQMQSDLLFHRCSLKSNNKTKKKFKMVKHNRLSSQRLQIEDKSHALTYTMIQNKIFNIINLSY